MKIILPGGSGHLGTLLARAFHGEGHEVVTLSRRARPTPWRTIPWDGETLGGWAAELESAEVVINLAGRSVNCRYGRTNRQQILDSRVRSTRVVAEAIARAERPPATWFQASTATIYAHRHDAPHDEATGCLGGEEPDAPDTWRFSIAVAKAWEQAAMEPELPATRRVLLRSAIVMSAERGAPFELLLWLVRSGLGGRQGDGRQFVSWIHAQDFVRAVRFLVDRPELAGVVNLAAPNPLPNAAFMRTLRHAWGRRFGLSQPSWMLELGAALLGTETELVLKSRYVVPGRLRDAGFTFTFPRWREAAEDLCRQTRQQL